MSYYHYVGNFKEKLFFDSIFNNYPLKNKKQYDWKPIKFIDLPDEMKYLCFVGSDSLHKTDHILTNPEVIVERHHKLFSSKKKINFLFLHIQIEKVRLMDHAILFYIIIKLILI